MPDAPVHAVAAAARGDQGAWNELVEHYTPLVVSVIRRYRLSDEDGADVNQTLWLRLVEHLDRIREPRALPMWIITTTRNECLQVLRSRRRTRAVDPATGLADTEDPAGTDVAEDLLRAERHQVLREGFAQLPRACRDLLAMLSTDPPASYAEITSRLGMPRGSIGPTRARCLEKLRQSRAVTSFLETVRAADRRGGGQCGQEKGMATVG